MRTRPALGLLVVLVLAPLPARAQAPAGKVFMGREIAPVSRGSEWSPEFRARASAVLRQLGVKPGQVVADVGAGPGDLAFLLSDAVGPAGKVVAVDTDAAAVAALERRATAFGRENVTTRRGLDFDPLLPEGAFDYVLVAYAYHEFAYPAQMADAMRRALKPDGRLVLIERAQEAATTADGRLHRMARDQMIREMAAHQFRLDATINVALPGTHVLAFSRPPADRLAGALVQTPAPPADLAALAQRLEGLEQRVAQLATAVDGLRTRSDRPNVGGKLGRLQLVNAYQTPITLRVNGLDYALLPGEQRTLTDQLPGTFTYEIPGVRPRVAWPLQPGESLTLTVHP